MGNNVKTYQARMSNRGRSVVNHVTHSTRLQLQEKLAHFLKKLPCLPDTESSTLRNLTTDLEQIARIQEPLEGRGMLQAYTNAVISQSDSSVRGSITKRQFVLQEPLNTEKDYVSDLNLLIKLKEATESSPDAPSPDDVRTVFGNVEQLHEWHKDTLLVELQKCSDSPQAVANIFINHERQLVKMYVTYCENKPKSERIVTANEHFFDSIAFGMSIRLGLLAMQIKPVQRIMKYQLLVKDILKCTKTAGDDVKEFMRAYHVMCLVPKKADDMMNMERLQNFPENSLGKLTSQGRLLLQGPMEVMERSDRLSASDQKFKQSHVFLFEQLLIVATMEKVPFEHYDYRGSIKANRLTVNDGGTTRDIIVFDSGSKDDYRVVLRTSDDSLRKQWFNRLREILNMRMELLQALERPTLYHREESHLGKNTSS